MGRGSFYLQESVFIDLFLGETICLRAQVMEQQGQVSLKLLPLNFLAKRRRLGSLRLVIHSFLLMSVSVVVQLLLWLCGVSNRPQWQHHVPLTLLLSCCIWYQVCIIAAPFRWLLLPATPRCRVLLQL